MVHKGTQRLETDRLILRRLTLEDAPAMFRNWARDPRVTRYLSWPPHADVGVSRAVLGDWEGHYPKEDYYHWGIELKEGGILIGSIGAVEQNDNISMVHVGYCIGYDWWHQGYTSEALSELIRFFFEEVGLNRIESCHEPANVHSGHVMEKCGLRYEGLLRQTIRKGDQLADARLYAILKEDFKAGP